MDGQINLFGEYQEYPKVQEKPKGREKYKTMQQIHGTIDGKICKHCQHCRSIEYANKYYKCELWILSHSSATDIRLKNTACGLYKEKGR
jgi:hypothetical protein